MTTDEKVLFFITLMMGVILLVFLTISVHRGQWKNMDKTILSWFQTEQSKTLDQFFATLTWMGSLWLLLPASLMLTTGLLLYGYHFEAMGFTIGFLGATVTSYLIKFSVNRERPCFFIPKSKPPSDPAFPSAHTTQVFSFVTLLWLVVRNQPFLWKAYLLALFFTIATGVAISRLYLQVHFPSDIVAGVLVSLIWTGIAQYFLKSGVLL